MPAKQTDAYFSRPTGYGLPGVAAIMPWDGWAPWLSQWQAWNERANATWGAMSSEWLSFVHRRIAEDMSFQQELAACKRIDDAWRAYAQFLERMAADYQREMAELARLGGRLADEGMDAGRRTAERSTNAAASAAA